MTEKFVKLQSNKFDVDFTTYTKPGNRNTYRDQFF